MAQQPQSPKSDRHAQALVVNPVRLPYPKEAAQYQVDEGQWRALVDAVWPGAQTVDGIMLALSWCKWRKLDPIKRPCHIVPIWNAKLGRNVEGVWPSIGEVRITAFRTGQYAGIDEATWGPMMTKTFTGSVRTTRDGQSVRDRRELTLTFPEWCRMTVYRIVQGQRVAFVGPKVNYLAAYGAVQDTDLPNEKWAEPGYYMLEKCFCPETQVLTDRGFQRFDSVTGRVLQVTPNGLLPTEAKPFCRDYSGEMVALHSRDLDFAVTPNHDMVTTTGKIEARQMFDEARARPAHFIPRCSTVSLPDFAISDSDIKLGAAYIADGFNGHGGKLAIKVSRPHKVMKLAALEPISTVEIETAGLSARLADGRVITTRANQIQYLFAAARIASICDAKTKTINCDMLMSLSRRQAQLLVDTWIEFDGTRHPKTGVRLLYTSRPDHADAFELASVIAGYAVSHRKYRESSGGRKPNIIMTISERSEIGVIRWGRDDDNQAKSRSKANAENRTGLEIEQNTSGKVWCVTVPSGVIVVRRHGFSMLCGNCAEAAALRRAFPEEMGDMVTAEEMEGRRYETQMDMGGGVTVETPTQQQQARPQKTEERFADKPSQDVGSDGKVQAKAEPPKPQAAKPAAPAGKQQAEPPKQAEPKQESAEDQGERGEEVSDVFEIIDDVGEVIQLFTLADYVDTITRMMMATKSEPDLVKLYDYNINMLNQQDEDVKRPIFRVYSEKMNELRAAAAKIEPQEQIDKYPLFDHTGTPYARNLAVAEFVNGLDTLFKKATDQPRLEALYRFNAKTIQQLPDVTKLTIAHLYDARLRHVGQGQAGPLV